MISSFHFPAGESCEVLECQYHAKCFQTANGYAECRCPRCHPEDGPAREAYVCGDNDKSYLTMCVLRLESCLLQTWIQKKHDGFCGKCYCILAKTTRMQARAYSPYQSALVKRSRKFGWGLGREVCLQLILSY